MTLPARATIGAAANFIANLAEAKAFLIEQDEATAAGRFRKLQAALRDMTAVLAWAPASGRPARFLSARSAQAQLKAQRIRQLATRAGLPDLREYLTGHYVVLYAHSSTEVLLLALKHQRQLGYSVGPAR